MIQRCFFFLLILVPCIVRSNNDVDSAIEDLNNISEVLQESVSFLMKQATEMKKELERLSSAASNAPNQTFIAELMESMNSSKQQTIKWMQWRNNVDAKLSKVNGSMDKAMLEKSLQPVSNEIKQIEKDLAAVSQKEGAVQKAVTRQIQQMSFLTNKMNEKEKKDSKDIGELSSRTQILEIQMKDARRILRKVAEVVTVLKKKQKSP